MGNNINLFSLTDIHGYTLSIYFTDGVLWYNSGDIYIIEIKDICDNLVFKCNIHYDILMHILFTQLSELYEYDNPFEENLPLTSTTSSNNIMGYTNDKENIVLAFTEYNIISHRVSKYIELEYNSDTIYNTFQSGELFDIFDFMEQRC